MDTKLLFFASSCCLIGNTLFAQSAIAGHSTTPSLMLANVYEDADVDLNQYWVSEKYDGIRAYWDGKQLWTRHGNAIRAPEWFTRDLPATALDGELWAGRNRFEVASSAVLDAMPDDSSWRQIRFMVFDLPKDAHSFDRRLASLNAMQGTLPSFVQIVVQRRCEKHEELLNELHRVVASGGEGLMLHRGDSMYRGERSDDLLKMKPARDAEARVVAYTPGKGKYAGQVGALVVETRDGTRFSIGSGLSDRDRLDPPTIGTWVTYRFQTLTANGIPRFARFVRVREEGPRRMERR